MISWNREHFLRDGKPFYFASGEIHCYRVAKSEWRDRFAKLKASGADTVATYLPWRFHEPEEGVFRFNAVDGITDIADYCTIAAEEGLNVIVRPGPYSYSELMADGLPDWLIENYPEVLARRIDGTPIHLSAISYMHPVLVEKVKRFYREICQRLVPHLASRGGNIIIFQLDNETTGVHVWRDSLDYNRDTCGFGSNDGRYAKFLRQRYGAIEKVNAAYKTAAKEFKDIFPATELADEIVRARIENDYGDFYCAMTAEFMKFLRDTAVENGIDIPFCHNSGNIGLTAYFQESISLLGKDFIVGCDHYWNLSQDWPQNNPTPQKIVENFLSCGMLNSLGYPAWIPEFQYGNIAQWPPVTAEDLAASLFAHLAFGMQGHNGYVFAGGENPPGSGWSCKVYDYGAPVSAEGVCRPAYDSVKKFSTFAVEQSALIESKPDTDVAIIMDWDSWRPGYQDDLPDTVGRTKLRSHMRQSLLSTVFAADMVPQIIDTETKFDKDVVHCVLCGGVMRKSLQLKLADFVADGGKLLIFGAVPRYDENCEECTLLATALDIPVSTLSSPKYGGVDFNGSEDAPISGELFVPVTAPSDAEIIGRESRTGEIAAYTKCVKAGKVAVDGAMFKLLRFSQSEFFAAIMKSLGREKVFFNSNPWVMTMRRIDGQNRVWTFFINASTSKQSCDCRGKFTGTVHLSPMEIKVYCQDKFVISSL